MPQEQENATVPDAEHLKNTSIPENPDFLALFKVKRVPEVSSGHAGKFKSASATAHREQTTERGKGQCAGGWDVGNSQRCGRCGRTALV